MTGGTLIYIFREKEILLAMKKRGFGVGKWNGAGGKLHSGESAIEGARREAKEELDVEVVLHEPLGRISFHDDKSHWDVHVFSTTEFSGEPKETEEMRPQWFPIEAIPYAESWESDQYWLPLLIAGKKFTAEVWLDAENHVTECKVTPV